MFGLLTTTCKYYGGILMQVEEASKLKNTDIAKELCLPPVKLHCSSMYCYNLNSGTVNFLLFLIPPTNAHKCLLQ